jgi:hypothetical protein
MLLSALKSVQKRTEPSGFFTSKMGAAQGEFDGLMTPAFSILSISPLINACSVGPVLYGGLAIGYALSCSSILCTSSIPLLGGNEVGKSSGKTSLYSLSIFLSSS